MADVTWRRTGELLRKLFEILLAYPDGLQARDAIAKLQGCVQLTDYEQGSYESGGSRFEKIVRFGTVTCVKAGWFVKNKGKWSVTADGEKALKQYVDPEQFYKEAVKLYHEWKGKQPPEDDGPGDGPKAPVGRGITFEEAEEQAWAEIEKYLASMNPYEFQELVASLLRAMGYYVSYIAPPGKDGGIDIIAWNDPLGTKPPRIKVQVKRRTDNINVDGIRAFMALLGDDDAGLFVTAGGFTRDAEETARNQESRKITLVDLERLFDLWVENYGKLDETAKRRLPLQPIYFLAPEE